MNTKHLLPCVLFAMLSLLPQAPGWTVEEAQPASSKRQKPPFENELKGFAEADKKDPPPKGAVLFVGSSCIQTWNTLAKDMAPLKVLNRGLAGSQASDALNLVDRIVIPYQPRGIVYYEGDNDVAAGKKPAQIRDDFKEFVAKVRAALPEAAIYVVSIAPSPGHSKVWLEAQEANALLQACARETKGVTYIDVATEMLNTGQPRAELFEKDKLHMNREGYVIWTKALRPVLIGNDPDASKLPEAAAKTAEKKLPFEDDIRRYEEADKRTPPPKGAVLFIGSSSIRMWNTLAKDMAPLTVLNRGFGGSRASDVLNFIDRIVIPYQPKSIVYYEGDNDLASGRKPEQIRDDVRKFVEQVRAALAEVPVYVISIKPSPSRAKLWADGQVANNLLLEYAKTAKGVTFIDVATEMLKDAEAYPQLFLKDNLHMNAQGYAIWTRIIKAALTGNEAEKPKQ